MNPERPCLCVASIILIIVYKIIFSILPAEQTFFGRSDDLLFTYVYFCYPGGNNEKMTNIIYLT